MRVYSSLLSSSPLEMCQFFQVYRWRSWQFCCFFFSKLGPPDCCHSDQNSYQPPQMLPKTVALLLWGTVNVLLPSLAWRTLKPRPHGVSIKTTPSSPVILKLDLQYRLWPHSPRLITLALQPRGALFSRLTTNGEETDFSFFFCCKILSVLSSNKSYSKINTFQTLTLLVNWKLILKNVYINMSVIL